MPWSHAQTYWESPLPSQTTQYNQTLVTYESETHAEMVLSANLYEIRKNDPLPPQYEFSIPVVVAANSRRNMGYTASYSTGGIPSRSNTLTLGDDEGAWVDIGDSFWFYGTWYTKVWITSNGFVTFDNRSYNDNGGKWTSPNPTSIPTTDDPNTILAPFWRDLDPSQGGTIEYGMGITGYFAVIWRDIPNKANGNTQTFALYFGTFAVRATHINFVYGSITNDVPTSIGIEDQTGKHGESVASISSGDKVEFTDESDNHYDITQIKVSASKLTVGGVNDEEARIYIEGWEESRPGGVNVILEDPAEGKYDVPEIASVAGFALGTAGLATGWGWIGTIGYLADAAILAYELSPMPRGTTVHEAMKSTETAYVQSAARDENHPSFPNLPHDVSINPLILWRIVDPSVDHRLVITAEVTIQRPDGTSYTLTTDSIELKLTPPVPVHHPVAFFTYLPDQPKVGETVLFNASASYDPDGFITEYAWDFNGDDIIDLQGTQHTAQYTYEDPGSYTVTLTVKDDDGLTNSASHLVTVISVHDVAVTGVTASPTKLNIGESVTINVNAENEGSYTETFDVTAYYDGNAIGTQTVSNLGSGGSTSLTFTWDTTGMSRSQAGDYTIKAVASTVSGETDTADNTYVDGVVKVRIPGDGNFDGKVDMTDYDLWDEYKGTTPEQWPPGIDPDYNNNGDVDFDDFYIWVQNFDYHDVAVTGVTASDTLYGLTEVHPGWEVTSTVTVKNEGDFSETFNVIAYYDTIAIDTQTVNSLAPGATTTLTFIWDTTGVDSGSSGKDYTIKAEASTVSGETDTADNTYIDGTIRVKVFGDVNNDGVVNLLDVKRVQLAASGWIVEPRADLNHDGEVNILDVKLVKLAYSGLL